MISFIIPVLNEAKFIEATIKTINFAVKNAKIIKAFEIVIIDDGSKDLIEKKINKLELQFKNIRFVRNNKNMGMGFSIRKGIKVVKYKKFMILPGGNDIDAKAISSSLKFYHKADLVMQCPLNIEEREKFRNIISKIYSLIFIIFFDCNVYYINGSSIFPTKHVKNLLLRSNRHGILSEIIAKLLRERISYCEIPVTYKWPHKARTTITLKNLIDVTKSFFLLVFDLKIKKNTFIAAKRKNFFF